MEINNKEELKKEIEKFNKKYSINYNYLGVVKKKERINKNIYFIGEENKINLEEERIRELVSELSFNKDLMVSKWER